MTAKIGIIGCGYVFDLYLATWHRHPDLIIAGVTDVNRARVDAVTRFYGLKAYGSTEELLADPEIDIVANFTSIGSHYEITKAALAANKNVYSEKPLVTCMEQARELVAEAERRGLHLSCAPSSPLGATAQTLWKAVRDGLVGDVRVVYAEMDDNPIYLMSPEGWRSRTGAPWPYVSEYEAGCTFEHVGYHLSWMCAIFGPVRTVTAFSKHTVPDKTDRPLNPPDQPDFSVACLDFHSGVVGRITCSISAPYDHRMRIIGNRGIVEADNIWDYRCPVSYEPFTKLSLNARKSRSVRKNTLLQWPFGVGGRKLPLVETQSSAESVRKEKWRSWWNPKAALQSLKSRELGREDKCMGLAELAKWVQTRRRPFPPHDFTLHLTELTLAIQGAGTNSGARVLETSFDPVPLLAFAPTEEPPYADLGPSWVDRFSERILDRMHQH